MIDLLTLFILILATWRLSSLLAQEDGPFGILKKIRIVDCVWCWSFWWGIIFALLYRYLPDVAFWVALPFALSAGAIAWDRWVG